MIEIFKTDVNTTYQAAEIVDLIRKNFKNYRANFDLDDCDHILRVECFKCLIEPEPIISLLEKFGCRAEVLDEDVVPASGNSFLSLPG